MGTHPIFESDFDCLTEIMELDLPKKDDGLRGKYFMLQFDLDAGEDTDKSLEPKEIFKKSTYPSLLCPDSAGDLIGTEPKFYMEIEDTNDRGLGEVVAHIAEVYIKVKQQNTKTEQIDFQLTELVEWVGMGKVRLLYRVEREEGEEGHRDLGFQYIPTCRLGRIIRAYFLNTTNHSF